MKKKIFVLLLIGLSAIRPLAYAAETGFGSQILRYPDVAPTGTRPTYGSINLSTATAVGTSVLQPANGGQPTTFQTITANYTVVTSDFGFLAGGGHFSVTLPSATPNAGKSYFVKKTDTTAANIITVTAPGSQLVSGIPLTAQTESLLVQSDGTNWDILAHYKPFAYWKGIITNASSWSTSSTSLTDPTNSGGVALAPIYSSGIAVTQASALAPGITLTPLSTTAAYRITAAFTAYNDTTSSDCFFTLTDGSTVIAFAQNQTLSTGANSRYSVTLNGIYAPAATTSKTLKIQMAASSGTTCAILSLGSTIASTIDWTLNQITY